MQSLFFMEVGRIELGSGIKPPVLSLHPVFVRCRRHPWRLFLAIRSALTPRSSIIPYQSKKIMLRVFTEDFNGGGEN